MKSIITNIVAIIVGGLFVVGVVSIFATLDVFSVILSFVGAAIGSLSVDLFRWFRARRRPNELHEDVVQVIDQIFDKNIYGHNSQETGYIRAKGWKVPLTPEQITEMNKVLYVNPSK